jgi:hypothetical protein
MQFEKPDKIVDVLAEIRFGFLLSQNMGVRHHRHESLLHGPNI